MRAVRMRYKYRTWLARRVEQSGVGVIQHHIFYPSYTGTYLPPARMGVTE